MNLNQRLEPLPELDVGHSDTHEFVLLGATLIIGLTFVVPALTLGLGIYSLVFVVLTGAVYGVLCLLLRRLLAGSLIALLVTTTFSANIPLVPGYDVPGSLGPQLWLVQLPLVAAVVLVVVMGDRDTLADITTAEMLFAALIIWSSVAALLGATVRLDTAFYFLLHLLQGFLAFFLLRYAVQQELFSFGLVAQLFVGTVVAQSVIAVVQFLNGRELGVTALGESGAMMFGKVSLPLLGTFPLGTHIAGFTGMAYHLASLILLAVPLAVMLTVRSSGWHRVAFAAAAIWMAGVLRLTGTDAGYGAFAVMTVLLAVALLAVRRGDGADLSLPTRTLSPRAYALLAGAGVIIISGGVLLLTTLVSVGHTAMSGLDAANLDTRIQQWMAGIDLFVQHPLFGIGGMNFIYHAADYGLTNPLPIHNTYIAILAGTGLPGLLCYLALLGAVVWAGWVGAKHSESGLLLAGMLCGMVGYFAYAFWAITPLIMSTSFFPFWILAGAVVGAYAKSTHR